MISNKKFHLNKEFLKIVNYFSIFIFFLVLTFYLANKINFERHWTSFYDQEVTLAYNALLFNSGILQEYIDHSGFFTILFLSIFLKIINFLNLLSAYKFSVFNDNHNIDLDLQNIIFFTRIFSAFCVAFFLMISFFLINHFSKNKIFSVLLCIVIFFSIGTILQISQLRTELISMIFLLLSAINLIFFFKVENNFRVYNIIFFFLFLFCSILNKSQTFFYIPCILLLAYFSSSKLSSLNLNIKNFFFLKKKKTLYILLFIIFFYIILKQFTSYNPFSRAILNIIFLISNVVLINFFFYFCLKNKNVKIYENLAAVNFLIITIFFLFKSILFIHPSTNEEAFRNTFTNIMNVFTYTKYYDDILTIVDGPKYINILITFKKIIFNTFAMFKIKLNNINYYSYLIFLNLFLSYFFKNELKSKKIIFNIICIFIFFYISSINELRGALQYRIFSDFFLILSFANFGNLIKLKKNILLVSFLIFFSIALNKNNIVTYINSIKIDNINQLCNDSYFDDWHKRIAKNDFVKFCTKYKF